MRCPQGRLVELYCFLKYSDDAVADRADERVSVAGSDGAVIVGVAIARQVCDGIDEAQVGSSQRHVANPGGSRRFNVARRHDAIPAVHIDPLMGGGSSRAIRY